MADLLRVSAAELARKIKVPTNRIAQILNGTRARAAPPYASPISLAQVLSFG